MGKDYTRKINKFKKKTDPIKDYFKKGLEIEIEHVNKKINNISKDRRSEILSSVNKEIEKLKEKNLMSDKQLNYAKKRIEFKYKILDYFKKGLEIEIEHVNKKINNISKDRRSEILSSVNKEIEKLKEKRRSKYIFR